MNLQLTTDNDLAIVDGGLKYVNGLDEIAQKTRNVLQCSQGDWFLDLDQGLPFFQEIFRKAQSLSYIENIYLEAINSVPGIIDINEFKVEFEPSTRVVNITFKAATSDGVLNFNLEG